MRGGIDILWEIFIPGKAGNDSLDELEWEIVEPNKDGRFNCLDCKETYSTLKTAKAHYKKVHMDKKFICQICDKAFKVEEHLNLHLKSTHMLPKKGKAV